MREESKLTPTKTVHRRLGWKIGAVVASVGMAATTAITVAPSPAGAAASLATIKVSMVPKLLGLTVFEANEQGAQQVAGKLGISFTYTAPATASAEGQVAIFKAEIAQHYNVITMSSDDPTVPAPVLQEAMKDGIQVITYDSDVPSARDFFMQDTAYSAIASGLINAVEAYTGPKADIAIMSSTADATIQNAWIGAMKTYIAAKYPGLKIVATGYGQSVESVSFSVAEGIIHAYPAIKAIIPIDSAAIPGTAKAISDLGKSGKIGVFGIGRRRRTGPTSPAAPCRRCSFGTRSARASWTCSWPGSPTRVPTGHLSARRRHRPPTRRLRSGAGSRPTSARCRASAVPPWASIRSTQWPPHPVRRPARRPIR